MKHWEQTFATYVYNHCNICNIPIYFCNIHLKHLQHTSETSETLKIYACNMRFRHIATSPCCLQNGGSTASGVHRRQPCRRHHRPAPTSTRWTPPTRGRWGPLRGPWYRGLHARHAAPRSPATGATVPTTIGSLAAQWIWWKEQRGRVGRRHAARDADERPHLF